MDANGNTGSVGNFNWIKLSPNNVPPPPPPPPPPGGQSPYKGSPFAITNNASTVIEFEDYDLGGEGVAYHDADSANLGGAYRTGGVDLKAVQNDTGAFYIGYTKATEWTEYTVDVHDAGTYNFDIRYASSGAGGTFHLEVDGVNVTGTLTASNSGGWQSWKTITKSGLPLSAGQHVIRLALDSLGANGNVGNLNYLKIYSPTSPPPPPPPPASSMTIQAEDFDAGAEGVAYHDLDASNNGGQYRNTGVDIQSTTDAGGGYNLSYVKAGEWLNYTVNVTSAGTYKFDFRVASAGTNGKFHLEVDGVDVTGQLTVPNTAGWQNWTTVTMTGINLTAGTHVLKLRMDANGSTGSVGNFNWLKLTKTA
jgi:hypothetical protein